MSDTFLGVKQLKTVVTDDDARQGHLTVNSSSSSVIPESSHRSTYAFIFLLLDLSNLVLKTLKRLTKSSFTVRISRTFVFTHK